MPVDELVYRHIGLRPGLVAGALHRAALGDPRDESPEPGHEPAAPAKPMMWRKAGITTLISALVWGVVYLSVEQGWIDVRSL